MINSLVDIYNSLRVETRVGLNLISFGLTKHYPENFQSNRLQIYEDKIKLK